MKSMFQRTRRDFLTEVGRGVLLATVGSEIAGELGLWEARADDAVAPLNFGELEPLVCMMQETSADALLPGLARELERGADLRRLVAAGALANARTFGGEDYVGFHTMMALAPAYHMAQELPKDRQALPVFKVLYRNTNRIQEAGGRKQEVLHVVKPGTNGRSLREIVRQKDVSAAEQFFAGYAQRSPEDAFNEVLEAVQDDTEVHRTVLPYRAWDLLGIIGKQHAHTLLRQSVHYCVKAEAWSHENRNEVRTLLPKLLEEHKLLGRSPGDKKAEDKWIEELSSTFFAASADQAASAAAAALAEGMHPDAIGEAISLAANQLVLRDMGRTPRDESVGKPVGSVHGDSVGVHASDSANAWRNMARVSNGRNCFASLILGAYQVAYDRVNRGGDFTNWKPLPVQYQLQQIKGTDPEALLSELNDAIRANLQAKAAAVVHRYSELGHNPRPVFDVLLKYAVTEDGALHAEKYYRTVCEEFNNGRPAFRWRHVLGLARVTASEYGRPAAGIAQARELLKV